MEKRWGKYLIESHDMKKAMREKDELIEQLKKSQHLEGRGEKQQ